MYMQSNQPVNNNPSWGAVIGAGLGGAAALAGSRYYSDSSLKTANENFNKKTTDGTLSEKSLKKHNNYLEAKDVFNNYKPKEKAGFYEAQKGKAKAYAHYQSEKSAFMKDQNDSYKKSGAKFLGTGKRRAAGLGASIIAGGLLGNAIDN